jgi:hypothetical protein
MLDVGVRLCHLGFQNPSGDGTFCRKLWLESDEEWACHWSEQTNKIFRCDALPE